MNFKAWLESQIIPVKNVRQSHDYDCGAASLKSLAHFYDVPLDKERDFIKLCDSGVRKGTHPSDIVRGARKLGLHAKLYNHLTIEQLKSLLDKKIPVICAIQAYGEEEDYDEPKNGHYVIAVGHDEDNIYFEDPSMRMSRGYIPIDEFMRRWHDKESYTGETQVRMGIVVVGDHRKPDRVDKAKKIE